MHGARTSSAIDLAKLHFVVLLWGFTSILGHLIDLPSAVLVFYRVTMAAAMLALLIRLARPRLPRTPPAAVAKLFANGLLLGAHWYSFFLAVHIANPSVCMLGMATSALWTALLEPLMVRGRRHRRYEFALGAIMISAIALVAGGDFQYGAGLAVAIASSGIGTTFSIINARFTRSHHHYSIAFHQMLGAAAFSALIAAAVWFASPAGGKPSLVPDAADWGWLFLLASCCTVFAYSQYIELLRRLSVFTVHLSYNLEPVYGILLAAALLGDHKDLSPTFYLGTAIIALAVFAHPFLERQSRRPPTPTAPAG